MSWNIFRSDKLKSIMNAAECFDTNVDILPCLSSSLIHYNKSDLNKSLFLVGTKRKNETKSQQLMLQ